MKIFWIDIYEGNYTQFFGKITQLTEQNRVFTPNPEILLKTLSDEEFKNMLKKADILVADGIGLYLAYQIIEEKNKALKILKLPYFIYRIVFDIKNLYAKYWEKVCGSDLTRDLLTYAQEHSITITILDPYFPKDRAKCKAQDSFTTDLQKVFPKLKFDFYIYKETEKQNILDQIRSSDSSMLFSTLGMKAQEQSVIEVMEACPNIKLWLWVWSSFDYFTGFQKRAPKLMRNLWIEWLYRIITWPQKLKRIKRLWNAIFVFTWEVYKR